jgi:hypothetical protein
MFLAFFRNVPYLYRKACNGAYHGKPQVGIPIKAQPRLVPSCRFLFDFYKYR